MIMPDVDVWDTKSDRSGNVLSRIHTWFEGLEGDASQCKAVRIIDDYRSRWKLYILWLNNYEMSFCELSWIKSYLHKWSCTTLITKNPMEMIIFWNLLPTMFFQLSWSKMSIYPCMCLSGIIRSRSSMIDHDSLQLCMIDQTEKDSDQEDMNDRNWPQLLWEV